MQSPFTSLRISSLVATPLAALLGMGAAHAGGTIKINDEKWVSIGAGLRTSFSSVEHAAPNGSDASKDFAIDNIRLYVNGQVTNNIQLEFNTERDASNNDAVRVLDAVAKIGFDGLFNVWMGRFLPPSDRSNLDGPFYLNIYDFPFVQAYPAIFAGRDDGAALWGQTGGGKFKYQIGAFQGRNGVGTSNTSDNLLYAARLTYNFWDPEPGYYNSSTYYGAKDILALGVAAMSQNDGAGTPAAKGDFTGWNIDALLEKKLADDGVATLEGAYYHYDLGGIVDATLTQGKSYFVLASYLFPQKVGMGRFQPQLRYQNFDRDASNAVGNRGTHSRTDVGVSYIIDGHNARMSLIYANEDPGPGASSFSSVRLGLQLQI